MESASTSLEVAERIVIEEFRTLQRIISHHQELSFRLKAWYAAALGALSYAVYLQHIPLAQWEFFGIGLLVTLSFTYWLLFHRDVVALAIQRSAKIEEELRERANELGFSGPRIAASLSRPGHPTHSIRQGKMRRRARLLFKDEQVGIPCVIAILAVACLTAFVPPSPAVPVGGSGSVIGSGAQGSPFGQDTGTSKVPVTPPGGAQQPEARTLGSQQPTASAPAAVSAGFDLARAAIAYAVWTAAAIAVILVIGGIFLLTRGHWFVKGVGAASMLAGASLSLFSIKEVKVEDIFKFAGPLVQYTRPQASNIYVDRINLQNDMGELLIKLLSTPGTTARLHPRHIGKVGAFPIGSAALDKTAGAADALDLACKQITAAGKGQLYLVVGATDRLPLEGRIRRQYDANVGLAMARANAVADYMRSHCWSGAGPEDGLLLPLAAGPNHTAPFDGKAERVAGDGDATDRRVDIYMLSLAAEAATAEKPKPADSVVIPTLSQPIQH